MFAKHGLAPMISPFVDRAPVPVYQEGRAGRPRDARSPGARRSRRWSGFGSLDKALREARLTGIGRVQRGGRARQGGRDRGPAAVPRPPAQADLRFDTGTQPAAPSSSRAFSATIVVSWHVARFPRSLIAFALLGGAVAAVVSRARKPRHRASPPGSPCGSSGSLLIRCGGRARRTWATIATRRAVGSWSDRARRARVGRRRRCAGPRCGHADPSRCRSDPRGGCASDLGAEYMELVRRALPPGPLRRPPAPDLTVQQRELRLGVALARSAGSPDEPRRGLDVPERDPARRLRPRHRAARPTPPSGSRSPTSRRRPPS